MAARVRCYLLVVLLVVTLLLTTELVQGQRHHNLRATITSDDNDGGAHLPVFFFHGLGSDAHSGDNFHANLTADGRVFIALTFCQDMCSGKALSLQVQDAIVAIDAIVRSDSATYKYGYIFMGLSQGALLARAVVEEWDAHNVQSILCFAAPQTGLFYGPQLTDFLSLAVLSVYGPQAVDARLFDFSKFSPADYTGTLQRAIADVVLSSDLQNQLALVDMLHMPLAKRWLATQPFLATINNLNVCGVRNTTCRVEQQRRRRNFLKLTTAHFFGSPADDFVSPWQSALFGEYTDVRTPSQLQSLFSQFKVLPATQTGAYVRDTFGLQTLDRRGGLFLHAVPDVGHSCWVRDYVTADGRLDCKWQPVFDAHIYPVLQNPLQLQQRHRQVTTRANKERASM